MTARSMSIPAPVRPKRAIEAFAVLALRAGRPDPALDKRKGVSLRMTVGNKKKAAEWPPLSYCLYIYYNTWKGVDRN